MASVQMVEALGFAELGKGAALFHSGATRFDGRLPINPSGGRIGCGHAVGATGVLQVLEISRQLRGIAGDNQITKGACSVGLTANMGGNDKTTVVSILGRR
jgi:acetyl-CoA C-acetyltransferase